MKFIVGVILLSSVSHAHSIKDLIVEEANRQGLEPEIALAVARVESNYTQAKVGGLGEIGIFQLRPQFAQGDIYTAQGNIREGVRQLLYWKSNCPVDEFVICYNGGFRHPKYPLLNPYYKKVMEAML